MKRKLKKLAALLLATLSIGTLSTACQSSGSSKQVDPPPAVQDLSIDFESGEYSFTGVEGATSYYVRLVEEHPAEGDADMPMAARRIRVRNETTEFSGVVDLSELQPGDSYLAYVYSYAKDDQGELIYNTSEPISGVYKTNYKKPTATGVSFTMDNGTASVELSTNFFSAQFQDKAPTFLITLYENGTAVDSAEIPYSALAIETVQVEGFFGMMQEETHITGTASFQASNTDSEYTITITVLSTDDTAFYDSPESDPIPVGVPADNEAGGEMGGFPGGGFPGGGFPGEGAPTE